MGIRRRDIAPAAAIVAAATVAAAAVPARAQPKGEATWDLIKRTGKVRMGVFDYPPYFLRDKSSGEWVGAMVEMGKDIAKELDVKLEMVETGGFGEAVLTLQSGKVDMNFGLQATPKRATAIDFAGPIYWIEWVTVNNPKFHGKVWADYNKPEVKVAVMQGSSDELLLRKIAPKATRIELKDLSQIVLATSSGRADAFTTTVLSSMVAKLKNPGLGDLESRAR
jgi:polar amino acid transport system substrate-binding protein